MADDELYVERLLQVRLVQGKPWSKEYLVKWAGYDRASDNSWECVASLCQGPRESASLSLLRRLRCAFAAPPPPSGR
jgi:hypothetical protein